MYRRCLVQPSWLHHHPACISPALMLLYCISVWNTVVQRSNGGPRWCAVASVLFKQLKYPIVVPTSSFLLIVVPEYLCCIYSSQLFLMGFAHWCPNVIQTVSYRSRNEVRCNGQACTTSSPFTMLTHSQDCTVPIRWNCKTPPGKEGFHNAASQIGLRFMKRSIHAGNQTAVSMCLCIRVTV